MSFILKHIARNVLLVALTTIYITVFGQKNTELGSKRVKYFSAEDYNAHAQNWSVFQDKQGMLYFGNNDGVLIYDGQTWKRVGNFNVRCFSQGKKQRIYAGGDNEFGYFEPNALGKLEWFSYAKRLSKEYDNFLSILSIQQINDETVFLGFREILVYKNDSLVKVIRPQTDFRFSFKYKDRVFFMQTDVGLMEFKNNNIYKLPHGDFFADKPIYMFEPYDENHALIATKLNGLFLVNIKNMNRRDCPIDSIYTSFKTEADNFFERHSLYHGTSLENGDYALGSSVAGIVIIDKKGHLKRVFNKQNGLPVNNVNFVFQDREKNIWLALNNGLAYIEMNSPMNFFGEESGFQGIVVGAMNFNGKFYIGTLEGLYVLEQNTDFTRKGSSFYKFKRLTTEYNSFMQLDTIDGKLYAATRYGFFEIDDEIVKPIKKMEFSYVILHSKRDPSIVYVNNTEGLAIFKKTNGQLKYSEQIKGIEHEVRYIYEDKEGSLWINGNNNDILKVIFNKNDFSQPVITTYDSTKGLPTVGGAPVILKEADHLSVLYAGLTYYTYLSGKSPVGKQDAFYPDPLFPNLMTGTKDSVWYFLATQFNNSVWYAFTVQQGLVKITPNKNGNSKICIISSAIGQASTTFFLYPDKKNNLLWYSTNKGLFSYNLNRAAKENISFNTVIRDIVVGKDSIIYSTNDSLQHTEIPFIKNSITFNFASLFFQGSERNMFRYYLEGMDETWLDWTKEKYITYNFLPEGDYIFHVKSKNMNGVESKEAVFHFVVLPPWYRAWWAYALYVITLILLVVIIVIIYGKRLKASNEKLEETVQNRTKEVKQQSMEIELKNTQLSEINKQLEKLSIVASEIENSVMIMDAKANFEWVNEGFIKLYGFTIDELIKEYGDNLIHYSKNPEIKLLVEKCVTEKKPIKYETGIITKDKKELWAHTTLTPILDKAGNLQKIVAIDSDITNLKKIEKRLTEQNEEIKSQKDQLEKINRELEKLSIVASQTDNTVMIMDNEANFIWLNESLLNREKITFDDFIKQKGKNLVEASYNPNIKRIIRKCLIDKKTVIYESETKHDDGKITWTQTTLTPIFDDYGLVKNLVAIDSDITKVKKAEEKIKLQSEELENNLNELSKKNELITNSIDYARKIQEAMLPSVDDFRKVFPQSFVFFHPRDVVSGDFFWSYSINHLHFAAIADCTGHGVPGAFMSIIGNTLLNEIVRDKKVYTPSEVLNKLNQGVVRALHQNELTQTSQEDGMDITFCVYDKISKKMTLAAAGHVAVLFRDSELNKIQGDLYTIGGALNNRNQVEFNQTEWDVNDNSVLYIYSDGYQDQFGGKENTKYMSESFEQFLSSIHSQPVDEQWKLIGEDFSKWKGDYKQIDDVLVIGIKFSDI